MIRIWDNEHKYMYVLTCIAGPGTILFAVRIGLGEPSPATQWGRAQSVILRGQLWQALLIVWYNSRTNAYRQVIGGAPSLHSRMHGCDLYSENI